MITNPATKLLPGAVLLGVLSLAATACGSGDPSPARTTNGRPGAIPSATPIGDAPPIDVPTTPPPPAGEGLPAVTGRWEHRDAGTGKIFALIVQDDGTVRSEEPGERNSSGRLEPTGPRTYKLRSDPPKAGSLDAVLSPDGRTLTLSADGETIPYTKVS